MNAARGGPVASLNRAAAAALAALQVNMINGVQESPQDTTHMPVRCQFVI